MPPDFDEIALTEEETNYAIYDARCTKYYEEKERKEKQQKAKLLLDCLTPFTCSQLKEYVLQNNPQFRIDGQSEKVFNLLCQYFANDPAFQKSGYSLAKGIMLTGPVGVGKTELLRVFSKNKRQCFHLVSDSKLKPPAISKALKHSKPTSAWYPAGVIPLISFSSGPSAGLLMTLAGKALYLILATSPMSSARSYKPDTSVKPRYPSAACT